jgi:hypothetical protein
MVISKVLYVRSGKKAEKEEKRKKGRFTITALWVHGHLLSKKTHDKVSIPFLLPILDLWLETPLTKERLQGKNRHTRHFMREWNLTKSSNLYILMLI